MEDTKKARKSPWRFLFLFAAVVGGFELLGGLLAVLLYLKLGDPVGMAGEAASLGIIGGADGPTAVFVAYSVPPFVQVLVPVLLVVVGIWGYLRLKGSNQKK